MQRNLLSPARPAPAGRTHGRALQRSAAAAALALACTFASAGAGELPALPRAPLSDAASTLHGVRVPDPYRWMEDVRSPQTQAWLRGQAAGTRAVLDRIADRDALQRRITELSAASGDSVRQLTRMAGERYFYLKRAAGERQYKLVMRQGIDGEERVLVDPERAAARTGVPHAVNYFQPSWDSRYVAYGMSAGGSENASLHIVDTASGRQVGPAIPRVFDVPLHWLPDSRSLTYTQLKRLGPRDPDTDTYKDARVMWWRVGTPSSSARPVFGPTVTPELGLDRLDVGELISQPGSPWLVLRTTDTTLPEGKLFVAPRAHLGRPGLRWRRIASAADQIVDVKLHGDTLYLLSRKDAPRRRLLALDLREPELARAKEVVAQPAQGVIEGFDIRPAGLVTEVREGTAIGLRRHAPGDAVGRPVALPAIGAARLADMPARDSDELIYGLSTWTELPRLFRLQGERSLPLQLVPEPAPIASVPVQVSDVLVESHDGVKVPMTVLHRRGLELDGRNPVLLDGYGAYGLSTTAGYWPGRMAWIERGGVLAYLNPRGSGVYGDDWHRAGFKQSKRNTWLDGVAAAKYLIAKGYGSPATMAVIGTSAGGVFAGRTMTTAPELFAAAVLNVGLLDAVRSEDTANGATNTSEFGTVKDPQEFKALLEMSTYHAIRDGVRYPAVLLVHGMNDPRVSVWESGKTAARLQAATGSDRPVLLRLDMQAGHGMGSTATQRDAMQADIYAFLLWQMGKTGLKD